MTYKDPDKQREYQRNWIAKRRQEWFDANGPCVDCGTWGDEGNELELDHIDSGKKVTHNVWSWAQKRRDEELAKCEVRCHNCHATKTRIYKDNSRYVLTDEDVLEIRRRIEAGEKHYELAKEFGVARATVHNIHSRKAWKHLW